MPTLPSAKGFKLLLSSAAIALALLSQAGAAHAQATGTITGRVTDAETGEPVSEATVRAVGTQAAATTRADGSYRLVVPAGSHDVRATFIGYAAGQETVTVPAGGS
ncbi:MAG TPA: carboxypeptidase-like regulatory domain-containing protein, partial [Gemmatimonadaceae bacterium]|nr:carboxypeptidase-like regulatory domain-containing protein [Gemmatimonadaceae bacterium]